MQPSRDPISRVALMVLVAASTSSVHGADGIDYLRDVKPIFRTHCVRCHGPLKSEARLRLDTRSLAAKGGENGAALVPGQAAASLLLKRVTAEEETRMPPEGMGLSQAELATLTAWISGGAVAPEDEEPADPRNHWSYQRVRRPAVPAAEGEWSHNPIDAFIARGHVRGGVAAAKQASPEVLLRRASLDLIGLPPSVEQLQSLQADPSPAAYARAVDSLLESPHYGERWGRHWLDVWRYSDWYGFQSEVRFSQKNMWHYRDWVVESLNADKGYERMAMEMLAGDEMTPFEIGALRATGFLVRNRNTDSREQWIRDTVEHTAKAFLAMTIACVQCHDHPYDPIWHDEYYRYRNIFEPVQVAIDSGGGGPDGIDLAGVARIFDRDQNAATSFYIRGNDKTPDKTRKITPGIPQVIGGWVEPSSVGLPPEARVPPLRPAVADQTLERLNHNISAAEEAMATAMALKADFQKRLEAPGVPPEKPGPGNRIRDTFAPKRSPAWRTGAGAWAELPQGGLAQTQVGEDVEGWLEFTPPGGSPLEFTLHAVLKITGGESTREAGITFDRHDKGGRNEGVYLTASEDRAGLGFFSVFDGERHDSDPLFRAFDVPLGREFALRIHVRGQLINVYVNDVLLAAHKLPAREPGGIRLWTCDASAEFSLLQLDSLPGNLAMAPADSIKQFSPTAELDAAHASHTAFFDAIHELARLRRATQRGELASFQGTLAAERVRLYDVPLREDLEGVAAHKKKVAPLAIVAQMAQRGLAVAKAREAKFLAEQSLVVAKGRRQSGLPPGVAADAKAAMLQLLAKAVTDAENKAKATSQQLTTSLETLEKPSTAAYSGLPGQYGSSSGRRLSLARWVADARNPLTARVAVNHIWLRHFGRALVTSVFEFGLSGERPSHPELLDWLASELVEPSMEPVGGRGPVAWKKGSPESRPWSMKHLHRLIVTSRAYRSASSPLEKPLATDPDNILVWRMPSRRMDAETVRDSILSVAGGLDPTLGGPDIASSDGLKVPRRSLYFHQSPEDQMAFLKLFDGADPAECYQRHVSIVPHQALALFNSEISLVHARRLARKLTVEESAKKSGKPGTPVAAQVFVERAFRQVLSRDVTTAEAAICLEFLVSRTAAYTQAKTPRPPQALSKSGAAPSADPALHARENLVHSLFNHHDFVTIK